MRVQPVSMPSANPLLVANEMAASMRAIDANRMPSAPLMPPATRTDDAHMLDTMRYHAPTNPAHSDFPTIAASAAFVSQRGDAPQAKSLPQNGTAPGLVANVYRAWSR